MGTYAEIPLSRGLVAIVDVDVAPSMSAWEWHASEKGAGKFYARRNEWTDGNMRAVYLHRVIAGAPDGYEVDHINGDSLDNRRENLRVCPAAKNRQNRLKRIVKSSAFKGVSWDSRRRLWVAAIYVEGRKKYLGRFDSEEAAARAYNTAATLNHREFANLNEV